MNIHQAIDQLEKGNMNMTDFLAFLNSYIQQMSNKNLALTFDIVELRKTVDKANEKIELLVSSMEAQRATMLQILDAAAPELAKDMRENMEVAMELIKNKKL